MILKAIKYHRSKNEWSIEGRPIDGISDQWLTLGQINLIVGQNATGKSNTIMAIRLIADLVSGETKLENLPYNTAKYELGFDDNGIEVLYLLEFENGKVTQEILSVDGKEKLNRKDGRLYYEGIQDNLPFTPDPDILAITRRDSTQHPFFDGLYLWGKSLDHHQFGGKLGKHSFVIDLNDLKPESDLPLKTSDKILEIYLRGEKSTPDVFRNLIISDMEELGYPLTDIRADRSTVLPIQAYGLVVKETGLLNETHQWEMSQGMFRAFSLLIQLNYSLLSQAPSCILIDDIGEGLDYDRSKSLIDLLISKIKNSNVQLIMTTNDRFVMNKIPLEYWCVIQRQDNKSLFYNYQNSKKTFDEFAFMGLNNFEFFELGFFEKGFEGLIAKAS